MLLPSVVKPKDLKDFTCLYPSKQKKIKLRASQERLFYLTYIVEVIEYVLIITSIQINT